MMNTNHVPHCYRDPLRQAIIGDCQNFREPRHPVSYVLLLALILTTFSLAWFHQEVMFYAYFYFQLLMSLCA